jgi:hypothetical protein
MPVAASIGEIVFGMAIRKSPSLFEL